MSQNKYHHESIYRGEDAIRDFGYLDIAICGAGALGSNLADTLTRQGFGSLKVIDKDRVETHNINTQVYSESDVGALKVDALKNKIFQNVGFEIEAVNKELNEGNYKKLLKDASLIVDCFDNSESRELVQQYCRLKHVSCLHMGLFEGYGEVIWDEHYKVPKNPGEGDICDYPLARNLVTLVVSIAAEVIANYPHSKEREKGWTVTLKDLAIRKKS